MVYDQVPVVQASESIVSPIAIDHAAFLILIAHAKAQVAHNDIIACERNGIVCQADAVAGSCLSGNGNVGPYRKPGLKMNGARYGKYNDPWCFHGYGCPETAGAIVVQVGNDHHLATPAACC